MATVTSLSQREFKRLISGETLLIVEFYARWCKPCQDQAKVIDRLAKGYASLVTFIRVDIDRHETIAMDLGIQSIPTVIIFGNGKEIQRMVGIQSAETLQNIIKTTELI